MKFATILPGLLLSFPAHAEVLMGPPAPAPASAELVVPLPDGAPPAFTMEMVHDAAMAAVEADQPAPNSPSFGRELKSVRWEMAAAVAAITATRVKDVTSGGGKFWFRNEGWFGKSTKTLGMDKMHHAYKTYVFADVLESLIRRRTGAKNAAGTGVLLGLGLMTYGEVLDGFTARTGYSNEDMAAHVAGAGVALARNAIPGMREKLDFRMELKPGTFTRKLTLEEQLGERKYLFALQLSGFRKLEKTPWRFVELHAGYYARGFTAAERLRGDPLRRKPYVGIGFNVQQFFAKKPKSRLERYAKGVFDYVQLPYTSVN